MPLSPAPATTLEALLRDEVPQDKIARVIAVGGSSWMTFVEDAFAPVYPDACFFRADVLTAVVDGLALAARDDLSEFT